MTISIGIRVTRSSAQAAESAINFTLLRGKEALTDVITDLTLETHRLAVRGVQRGPATGRTYRKSAPRRVHTASSPGEYPASDTGRLASSIKLQLPMVGSRNPVGQVYTNLRYGVYLELGTVKMRARPFLLRSFNTAVADAALRLRAKYGGR